MEAFLETGAMVLLVIVDLAGVAFWFGWLAFFVCAFWSCFSCLRDLAVDTGQENGGYGRVLS